MVDELEKISASHGLTEVSKSRTGVRPISVDNLIKKHNDGTLFKKKADSQGQPQPVRGSGADDPGAAQLPRRPGEVPTKDPNTSMGTKLGMVPGASTQTLPVTTGEDMTAGNSKPRRPGDVPTQANMDTASPNGRITQPPGRLVTNDQSAHKPKKGNTPTADSDMNKVDRYDQRDFATTVHGLGQSSTGIGAFNSPAEHY